METKKPPKRGMRIDITNTSFKQHTAYDDASCRTNKPVNHSGINHKPVKQVSSGKSFDSHNANIRNTEYTTDALIDNSTEIADSVRTPSTTVVCDGINFTVQLDADDQSQFNARLLKYSGDLKLKIASRMKPYKYGRVIYYCDKPIGQIRFDPIGEAGYFFLHVNPAKLDAGQSQLIQGLVSYLLDEAWCSFVGRAKVTMFDAAVDVGINIGSIIPVPARAVQSGYFLKFFKEGKTRQYMQGTEYVGSNTSEKRARIYDKAAEESERFEVNGSADKTRIEVQAKPRVRGKFASDVSTLAELPNYKNPLRMLSIAEFSKEAEQDDLLKLAHTLSAYVGSTAVLGLVGNKEQKRINRYLSAPSCTWWQPDKHWADFLRGLAQHPLFVCCNLLAEPAYIAAKTG